MSLLPPKNSILFLFYFDCDVSCQRHDVAAELCNHPDRLTWDWFVKTWTCLWSLLLCKFNGDLRISSNSRVSKPIGVVTCLETTSGWSYLEQTYKSYIAQSNSWSDGMWKCTDFCSFLGNKDTHFSSLSIFLIFHRFPLCHLLKTWCKFSCRNPRTVMSSSHPYVRVNDEGLTLETSAL